MANEGLQWQPRLRPSEMAQGEIERYMASQRYAETLSPGESRFLLFDSEQGVSDFAVLGELQDALHDMISEYDDYSLLVALNASGNRVEVYEQYLGPTATVRQWEIAGVTKYAGGFH